MSFVVDTSITLAWCFEEERTQPIMDLLYRLGQQGAHAPLLWPLEALNGLLMAQRRRRIHAQQREELAEFLRVLPVALDSETTEHAWTTTAQLADRHRLTAYDAAYLELALRRKLPLATLDHELIKAAKALGTTVLGT
jgi:predicted nucleic acid-binding protein